MAQNGHGAPVVGHLGRIPNYGKTQVNPMGNYEPPACIQNAMMTKDKKPFTYTPGGLDLSQIKSPSQARRMARQRSQEDQEQAYGQYPQANGGGNYQPHGGPAPPPPPPTMNIPGPPAPPPPPPLIIEAPNSKSPNPKPNLAPGERPEIVIPENPIGMLRKTNSPYHWEAEKAELNRIGPVPKFVEKVPSPLTVQMPPSSFSQQPPQSYAPQNNQRQNYSYSNPNPESPLHKPEAQYANKNYSPVGSSPNTRDLLQRQDSQFNKSPEPFAGQSPMNNGSPFSPSPNTSWRQPEKRDSPVISNSPHSPFNRGQFSPNNQQFSPNNQQFSPNNQHFSPNNQQFSPNHQQFSPNNQQFSPNQNQTPPGSGPGFHTLPRANNNQNNNIVYNNTNNLASQPQPHPQHDNSNSAPWRTSTPGRQSKEPETKPSVYHNSHPVNQQPTYTPPWQKTQEVNSNQEPQWKQNVKPANQTQQYTPPWETQDSNNNRVQENNSSPWRSNQNSRPSPPKQTPTQEPSYQSSMSIPVSARKQKPEPGYNNTPPQKEAVYVNQEPIYYCPDSPKAVPGFVKAQKEKTKTPPPVWCQRPFEETHKSLPRELVTPPRDGEQEPEWVRKSNEMQRGAREVVSPPKYQQQAQPSWSTRPSENRKSLPRDAPPSTPGPRNIPIQIDQEPQPQLRITIDMQPNQNHQQSSPQGPFSQPTQRIMRVLSPQLVRMDERTAPQHDLPTLNRSFQNNLDNNQPKTRIIPIQIEGGGNNGANNRVYYHRFTQEAPPRQSKAFRVLQVITGTQDRSNLRHMEQRHGFTDL